ncbi:MAG: hypothetical protein IJY67_07475 [Paludibacteraceae bacterium]|nr:hypothetical protein [Paludibacteraceae bacterium]
MKDLYLILKSTILIISLLVIITSCQKEEHEDISISSALYANTNYSENEYLSSDEIILRNNYIEENANIFGENLYVFDTNREMDSIVNEVFSMDYITLREWCTINNINNAVLNSKIIFDSILISTMAEYGYDYDSYMSDPNYDIDDDDLFMDIKTNIITTYSSYAYIYEEFDDFGSEIYVEPLNYEDFDEMIFMNNKNIIVVGLNVYKLVEDILLIIPIMECNEDIANIDSKGALFTYINSGSITEDNIDIIYLSSNGNTESNVSPKVFKDKSQRRTLKVKIKVYDSKNWAGNVIRNAHVHISNFNRGVYCSIPTETNVKFYTQGIYSGFVNHEFKFNKNEKIWYKCYKQKYMVRSFIKDSNIFIENLRGQVSNSKGLSINF